MLREVKFWARDILRGPMAHTPFGYHASWILAALVIGGLLILLLY
jgi:hypothetical protein